MEAVRPDLNGQQIMEILQIKPGPVVGRAYNFLLERRLDNGPIDEEEAITVLRQWWDLQPESIEQ
ncbi:CCA tRNA nucleotidyltransferase [compost metagenome]